MITNFPEKNMFNLFEELVQMSNGETRKVSIEDIQLVQNLIERCIQIYMTRKEAVSTLLHQAKIEPGFTELVWQKLEMENPEFFKAYYLRLIVKEQILRFNQLLSKQAESMRQLTQTDLVSNPQSNPSQIHSMQDNLPYQSPQQSIEPQNMQQANNYDPDVYTNSAQPMQQCTQVPGINSTSEPGCANSTQPMQQCMQAPGPNLTTEPDCGKVDLLENNMLLAQSPTVGMMERMNRLPQCGDYSLIFGDENIGIGDTPSTFTGGESYLFGAFGQMPRNFSFSDLTVDFSNSNDMLGSYSGSPFMGTDANITSSRIPGEQQGF